MEHSSVPSLTEDKDVIQKDAADGKNEPAYPPKKTPQNSIVKSTDFIFPTECYLSTPVRYHTISRIQMHSNKKQQFYT